MLDFILGLIVGVFGLLIIAVHLANKPKKPEAKQLAFGNSAA